MTTPHTRTRRRTRAAPAALLLALAASTAGPASAATAASGTPDRPAAGAVGIWQLDGYGTVLRVESGRLQEYQVTGISCLPGTSAVRVPDSGSATALRYATEDGDVLTVRPGSVRFEGPVGDRATRRLAALPERCRGAQQPGPIADPVATFDVFWQTFAENYRS